MRKGPGENDYSEINTFEGDTIPFDIGGLEKPDFQYLGKWQQLVGVDGKKVTPDIAERIRRQLPAIIQQIALQLSEYHDNVVAIKASMPPYMQDELKTHLGLA